MVKFIPLPLDQRWVRSIFGVIIGALAGGIIIAVTEARASEAHIGLSAGVVFGALALTIWGRSRGMLVVLVAFMWALGLGWAGNILGIGTPVAAIGALIGALLGVTSALFKHIVGDILFGFLAIGPISGGIIAGWLFIPKLAADFHEMFPDNISGIVGLPYFLFFTTLGGIGILAGLIAGAIIGLVAGLIIGLRRRALSISD